MEKYVNPAFNNQLQKCINIRSVIEKIVENLRLQKRLFNTIPARMHSRSVNSGT